MTRKSKLYTIFQIKRANSLGAGLPGYSTVSTTVFYQLHTKHAHTGNMYALSLSTEPSNYFTILASSLFSDCRPMKISPAVGYRGCPTSLTFLQSTSSQFMTKTTRATSGETTRETKNGREGNVEMKVVGMKVVGMKVVGMKVVVYPYRHHWHYCLYLSRSGPAYSVLVYAALCRN